MMIKCPAVIGLARYYASNYIDGLIAMCNLTYEVYIYVSDITRWNYTVFVCKPVKRMTRLI